MTYEGKSRTTRVGDNMSEFANDLKGAASGSRERSTPRITTGFDDLDRLQAITAPSVTVLFGPPAVGISMLALNIATRSAQDGIPALVVSWESPKSEIVLRVASALSRTHTSAMRAGAMTEESWVRFAASVATIDELDLSVSPGPRTWTELEAIVREWHEDMIDGAPSVLVLDGTPNLARLSSTSSQSVWEEHSRLSVNVRHLAYELGIAVVMTVPVVREALTAREYPKLQHVAYSPAYVHDADVVIAVSRDDQVNLESPRAGEADLVVLKSKHTPTGTVTLAFQGHYARFRQHALIPLEATCTAATDSESADPRPRLHHQAPRRQQRPRPPTPVHRQPDPQRPTTHQSRLTRLPGRPRPRHVPHRPLPAYLDPS